MQIVIDIDERDYETAKRWGKISEWTTVDCIMEAIANGTPLKDKLGNVLTTTDEINAEVDKILEVKDGGRKSK